MLSKSVQELPYVGEAYAKKLGRLGIFRVWDLLHHVPSRYIDFRNVLAIASAHAGETATIRGEVLSVKNQYTKRGLNMQVVEISDATGSLNIVFFNQYYLLRTFEEGEVFSFAGTLSWWGRKLAMVSPEYERAQAGVHTGRLLPVYHETAGVSSKWLRKRISEVLANFAVEDFLSQEIRKNYNLLDLQEAFFAVHNPKNLQEAQAGKHRLAFNEVLLLHLQNIQRKKAWIKHTLPNRIAVHREKVGEFVQSLPFKLTTAQTKVVGEILEDLDKDQPMNRLLEGDVGSGKTVVAAIAAYAVYLGGGETIIMAPTQILATQHAHTLSLLFKNTTIKTTLITGATKKEHTQADIYIGTHALIHRKVSFKKGALVIIDEQHKFGVEQRTHLVDKSGKLGIAPHVLTMTATPIPRTVALTFYGDMDLSVIDEMPKGRMGITTWIVPPAKRAGAYDWIKKKVSAESSQVFVVCPLIEESEADTLREVKAVKKEYASLKKIFPDFKLGLLHGRLKAKEKDSAVAKFKAGKTNILVSTPVVEVGIDVPAATIMLVEGAERFGLATLHQLRGRVGRGKAKSYCLLMTERASDKATLRLEALTKAKTGFELAELDLKLRGPGEIFGSAQHGFPELKVANWADIELIKATKKVAAEFPSLLAVVEDKEIIG